MTLPPKRIEPSDREAVAGALARIDGSVAFATSRQARQLLRYLADAALAGEGERLKGYTLGVEVLGRPPDFDPSTDTSVRVAMRRLRKLLADYYAQEGAADPARLHLVPGEYAPLLLRADESAAAPGTPPPAPPPPTAKPPAAGRVGRAALAAAALLGLVLLGGLALMAGLPAGPAEESGVLFQAEAGARVQQIEPAPFPAPPRRDEPPVLRVLPLTPLSGVEAPAAEALTRELRIGLARFTEIVVLDATAGEGLETVRLTGVVQPGGRFAIELREAASGRVLGAFGGEPGREPAAEAMRFVATAIAQPYGLLLSALARGLPPEPMTPGFSCVLRLFDYWRRYDSARIEAIALCLNQTPATGAAAGPILASRALAALERYRLAEGREPALLAEAYKRARRAVQAAPYDARAQQALGAVLYARGDVEFAIAALRNARRYNPWDPDIAADLAARLLGAGEVAEARALLREACLFVAARPAWMDFHLFLAELLSGNLAAAVDRAGRMVDDGFVLNEVARVIAARLTQDEAAVRQGLAALEARDPGWATEPERLLRRRLPSPEVARLVADALTGAARFADALPEGLRAGRGGCLGDRNP
jgi:tetratricopeptide (TPR) repeat protein